MRTYYSRRVKLREYLRTNTVIVPLLFGFVAAGLGLALPELDKTFTFPRTFGATSAQVLLGAIATGLITLTSIAISISIAGQSFGSSAMSPRILRWWSLSQKPKAAFGMFVFTFIYALVVLGRIAPTDDPDFVPNMSVWLSVGFLLLCVVALLWLMRYMSTTLRQVESIDGIAGRGAKVIRHAHPLLEEGEAEEPAWEPEAVGENSRIVLKDGDDGVIVTFHIAGLVAEAKKADAVLVLLHSPGSFITLDEPLFLVYPGDAPVDEKRLQGLVAYSDERTLETDPLYSIRLLVDIAIRALSPAINDPSTAVQALDRLTALLRSLGPRRLASGASRDDQGTVRLVVPLPRWDEYLDTALTEIRQFGQGQIQIARRLRALLEDLLDAVPDSRRPGVERHLRLLQQNVERGFPTPEEQELAAIADTEGLGAPRDAPNRPRQ
jgi:uncharacterized membrane protein